MKGNCNVKVYQKKIPTKEQTNRDFKSPTTIHLDDENFLLIAKNYKSVKKLSYFRIGITILIEHPHAKKENVYYNPYYINSFPRLIIEGVL